MLHRSQFTSVAVVGIVFALLGQVMLMVTMSGCVIVVDADSDIDCVSGHLSDEDNGTPRIGVDIEGVDAALAGQLNIDAARATLVRGVHAGWPAERAGVREFDVITKVDGRDDAGPIALQAAIREKKPGETITLSIIRNAQPLDVTVPVDAVPAPAPPSHDDNDRDDE